MATSLPIIPPRTPGLSQRPKLSVNTAQPRSFGKGASLRLETLSAVSPTRKNTFSNAYPATTPVHPHENSAATTPSSASTTVSSALTSASTESAPLTLPYKQPHNVISILANSPARSMISRKMGPTRPMFPAAKHVSFRTPLEEEVTTVKYTLAHSDIESSIILEPAQLKVDRDSLAPPASRSDHLSPPQSPSQKRSAFSSLDSSPRPKAPRTGDKRDSSSSEDESDSAPATPVAGRRKRSRDWRWTLGPLPGTDASPSSRTNASSVHES